MIPKISLKDLADNKKSTLNLLSDALSNHGFFVITDHKIPYTLFNEAYEYSEKFFNLDNLVKAKYSFREHAGARGYTPFGKETPLASVLKTDFKIVSGDGCIKKGILYLDLSSSFLYLTTLWGVLFNF